MPELPDVEGFRRLLAAHAVGRRIERAEVRDPAVLRNADPEAVARDLRGRRFDEPERRGKWLFARTDGPILLFHFGMSGALVWTEAGDELHRHDRLVLGLDHGELRFRDQRKLQGVWLAKDDRESESITGPLGPDALDISLPDLRERLGGRRRRVKAALMDQELIAGIGNILADEILWQARIHPGRGIDDLDDEEWNRLHQSLSRVVRESAAAGQVPRLPSLRDAARCLPRGRPHLLPLPELSTPVGARRA